MAKWFGDSDDFREKHEKKNREIKRKNERHTKEASVMSALEELAGQYTSKNEEDSGY